MYILYIAKKFEYFFSHKNKAGASNVQIMLAKKVNANFK